MTYFVPKVPITQVTSLELYLRWLKLDHDPAAVSVVEKLLSGINPNMVLDNSILSVRRISTKKEGETIDNIIRLSYSRYSNGMFPIDLCEEDRDFQHQLEDSYMVYNEHRFPMATIKSKLFVPSDEEYFINKLFTINEPWYYEEKLLQEASRWAAHPVYDIYRLAELKTEVMRSAFIHVVNKFDNKKIRTVGIFSQRVVQFIRKNKIAKVRKIKTTEKRNEVRVYLETHYPSYWRDGNPGVYEITKTL